ncbi:uncharacterized protein [Haliotis asinina]|uniref:uncharacterized protein n=1 Tax=Haliotis asinina TaxID=109174 RepID=UPI003531DF23
MAEAAALNVPTVPSEYYDEDAMKRTVKMFSRNRGLNRDQAHDTELPYIVKMGKKMAMLISTAGRLPICFKCNRIGHIRGDCPYRSSVTVGNGARPSYADTAKNIQSVNDSDMSDMEEEEDRSGSVAGEGEVDRLEGNMEEGECEINVSSDWSKEQEQFSQEGDKCLSEMDFPPPSAAAPSGRRGNRSKGSKDSKRGPEASSASPSPTRTHSFATTGVGVTAAISEQQRSSPRIAMKKSRGGEPPDK